MSLTEGDSTLANHFMVLAKVFMKMSQPPEPIIHLSEITIGETRIKIFRESIVDVPADVIISPISNSMDIGGGTTTELVVAVAPHFERDLDSAKALLFPFADQRRDFDVGKLFIVDLKGVTTDARWKYLINFVFFNWDEENLREQTVMDAVRNALQEADKLQMKTIALAPLGMDFFNVESDISARLQITAIEKFLRENPKTVVNTINIILGDEDVQESFQKELDRLKNGWVSGEALTS